MRQLVCLFLVVWLAGCRTVNVNTGASVVGEPLEDTAYVFLWGLVGDDVNVPANEGASRVEVYRSLGGWLVALLTVGIVQPMHVQVWPIADGRALAPAPTK
jgi:hypothetical protein